KTVCAVLPEVNAFNIPDLLRFSLRSWDACAIARKVLSASIPHIRAIDVPPGEQISMAQAILNAGLSEVLVIQGDHPTPMISVGRLTRTQARRSYAVSRGIIPNFACSRPLIHTDKASTMNSRPWDESSTQEPMVSLLSRSSIFACWTSAQRCCVGSMSFGVSRRCWENALGHIGRRRTSLYFRMDSSLRWSGIAS